MQKTTLSKLAASLFITGVALFASQGAVAATTTGTLNVSATVAANCVLSTADVAFGVYDPLNATPTDATGTLTLTCTAGATPSVALDGGANASGAQRRLINGAALLNYDLYQPAANTAGAACAFVTPYDATGFGLTAAPDALPRVFNVCGRLPAGQSATSGAYADTVTVTVTF